MSKVVPFVSKATREVREHAKARVEKSGIWDYNKMLIDRIRGMPAVESNDDRDPNNPNNKNGQQ